MKYTGLRFPALLIATLMSGLACAQSSNANAQLEALIRAAKAEGDMVAYSSQPQPINTRFAAGFKATYGINISFVRLSSGPLLQRFATEAAAGAVPADILFFPTNGSNVFLEEAKKKGWLAPITASIIPAMASGEYPMKFMRETPAFPTPVVSIIPWAFGYNTQKIAAKDAPKDWRDLLDPKYKNQIIRTDPSLSLGQMDPWRMLLARYGEGYFDKLREQNPRTNAPEAVAAAQALAAGEGSILLMTTGAVIQAVKDKGAPVQAVTPDLTTGVEMGIYLVAKPKHPNVARLAIHYALSRAGSKVQSSDPGSVDIYEVAGLPKEYQGPRADTPQMYDTIRRLLK